jgi:hypothetical protein
MEKVFLVYDEYSYKGIKEDTIVTPCSTIETAKRILKQSYERYLKTNALFQQYVDIDLKLKESKLADYDEWEVKDDEVEIYIDSKDARLNLYILEHIVVTD